MRTQCKPRVGKRKTRTYKKRKQRGGGKATLNSSLAPPNPYEKKSLERKLLGQIVSYFFFSRGPFPNNSSDDDGYVPLARLVSTGQMRREKEKYEAMGGNFEEKMKEVLGGAFEIKLTPEGTMIKAIPHATGSTISGILNDMR
jgi:hypothetical protein